MVAFHLLWEWQTSVFYTVAPTKDDCKTYLSCFQIYFQILTKDSVTVHVDAIMYYKVSNAICAISNVDDYGQSTRLLAATTLR